MYRIPDEVFVKEWRSDYTNAQCAARLRIKPFQLEYAWKTLKERGIIPRLPRLPRRKGGRPTTEPRSQWPESDYHCGPEEFDGRPRISDCDLLLERLKERGHDYAEDT